MEVAKRNKEIVENYISHEERHLQALVSQDNISVFYLNKAKSDFVQLFEKWERYQHGYEIMLEQDSLSAEIADACEYRRRILNELHTFENYIKSKVDPPAATCNAAFSLLNYSSASTVTEPDDQNINITNGGILGTFTSRGNDLFNLNLPSINTRSVRFNYGEQVTSSLLTQPLQIAVSSSHVPTYSTPHAGGTIPTNINFTPTPIVNVSSSNNHSPLLIDLNSPTNLGTSFVGGNQSNFSTNLGTSFVGANQGNFSTNLGSNFADPTQNNFSRNLGNNFADPIQSNFSTNASIANSLKNTFACSNQNNPIGLPNSVKNDFACSNNPFINSAGLPNFSQNFNTPNFTQNQPSFYQTSSTVASKITKLDRVKLKQFHGNVEDWQSYWDVFESLVHKNSDLDAVAKFTYLDGSLHGEGKKPIQGIKITSENYFIALELLHNRFGRNDVVIQNHIRQLLSNLSVKCNVSSGPRYVKALWLFYDEVVAHVRSLATLGIQGQLMSTFLCPMVLSKLPENIRFEWFKTHDECSGSLAELLQFMDYQFKILDRTVRAGNGGLSISVISEISENSIK